MVKQNLKPEIEASTASRPQKVLRSLQKRRLFGIYIYLAAALLVLALLATISVLFATGLFEKNRSASPEEKEEPTLEGSSPNTILEGKVEDVLTF